MRAVRPGLGQRAVLRLEAGRLASGIVAVVMAVIVSAVAVAAVLYPDATWSEEWRADGVDPSDRTLLIVAAVAGFICVVLLAVAVHQLRLWRIARRVRRLSDDPRLVALRPVDDVVAPGARSAVVPPLEVHFIEARKLPKVRSKQRVTRGRNITGRPPLSIVYLRLFDNQPRIRTFIEGAWREFGYVHLLRSADAVTPSEYRGARRSGDPGGLFVSDRETMLAALARAPVEPLRKGRHKLQRIAATKIRVRDRYGSFPVRAVLCHGAFWREGVDLLLDRADLVVLDLSGFTERNLGTRYELQRVIDRVPMERIVFLRDQLSKKRYLQFEIQRAWSQMAADSPNAGVAPRWAAVANTDWFHESSSSRDSGPSTTRLVARRSETRRLAARAQARVDDFEARRRAAAM